MTTEQITEEILWTAHSEGYYQLIMEKVKEIEKRNHRLDFHERLQIAVEELQIAI